MGIIDSEVKTAIAAQMERLRKHTDMLCGTFSPADIPGAINWGDLGCVAANYCIDNDGREFYQVIIEEAAEENPALERAIREALQRDGWEHVGVIITW